MIGTYESAAGQGVKNQQLEKNSLRIILIIFSESDVARSSK